MRKLEVLLLGATFVVPSLLPAATSQLLGWNNLGMHCMDSDYSVFSILPPYNTIEAQLVVSNRLVTNGAGYTVTYQAVADPAGSFNSTSVGKGNFYDFDLALYGADLAPDMGLAGWPMPGLANPPQPMLFERTNSGAFVSWFRAEGIPITPYDDAGRKNPYPMMRILARNAAGTLIASNDIVLPVSDEMDCRACHASGLPGGIRPAGGWVWNANPERDYRLNILRLHDGLRDPVTWPGILASNGFNPQGLYRTVVADGRPVLCAKCHLSEALPGTGYPGVPPLTRAVHAVHANVMDPDLGLTLDNAAHRAACYRCHPGSTTKCLRGAMGAAVAPDGTLAMQCQSCHGTMSQVGAVNRTGWLDEPNCQSCHVGNATNSVFRYLSVFDTNGLVRPPRDLTFATDANTPGPGLSLYRFSTGHGNLQCSACHGSTHAEFASTHTNDNVRNARLQGHIGMMSECTSCHTNSSTAVLTGGPHGLHVSNANHANGDHENNGTCVRCHGSTLRGTELSEAKGDRLYSTKYGTKRFWRGYRVGCYTCHNGTGSPGNATPWRPALVANVTTNTTSGAPLLMPLVALDTNTTPQPLAVRVISQPANGTVGVTNWNSTNWAAIYYPDPGFVGSDRFTFAAWNGYVDSDLATGIVTVAQGPFSIAAQPLVPPTYPAGWPAPFSVVATPSNVAATVRYLWDFGDGSPLVTNQFATHAYASLGFFTWTVVASVQSGASVASATNTGTIRILAPETLALARGPEGMTLSWTRFQGDALLEWTSALGPAAQWRADTNVVAYGPRLTVLEANPVGNRFYRLRQL
jgi:hypothetical protein